MSPRPYDRTLRRAAAEVARRRIAEAAAALHAKHGALGTSHAMIAKAAGVSLPTVYKYFPTRNDLIPACTGLVAGRAPVALDERIFEGRSDVPGRVRALARAVFRLHEHFAPWLRWVDAEAATLPALREFLGKGREERLRLLRRALTPPGGRPPAASVLLPAHVLLEYSSWSVLKRSNRAAAVAADSVLKLCRTSGKGDL
jgi:AcrR family transcriptional regulator